MTTVGVKVLNIDRSIDCCVSRCTGTSVSAVVAELAPIRRCCRTVTVTEPCRSVRRRRLAVGLCRRGRPTRTCVAPRRSTVNDPSPPSESVSSTATLSRPATGMASCATCRSKPAVDIALSSPTRLSCRLVVACCVVFSVRQHT